VNLALQMANAVVDIVSMLFVAMPRVEGRTLPIAKRAVWRLELRQMEHVLCFR
jgi:hypothetical protein